MTSQVQDRNSGTPIQFAHIVNRSTGRGHISDTLGYFTIGIRRGDLITVTAIGYFDNNLLVDSLALVSPPHSIEMIPRMYPIEAVKVNRLGTYEQFRQNVLNTRIPEPKVRLNPKVAQEISRGMDSIQVTGPVSLGSPITAIYNLLSKEGKSRRKLEKVLEQEELERQLHPKYSREMVGRITGLDGTELYDFIRFCNFDPDFLLHANEYRITGAILEKYKAWEALKSGENKN